MKAHTMGKVSTGMRKESCVLESGKMFNDGPRSVSKGCSHADCYQRTNNEAKKGISIMHMHAHTHIEKTHTHTHTHTH